MLDSNYHDIKINLKSYFSVKRFKRHSENLSTTILMHGVVSLPDATSYHNMKNTFLSWSEDLHVLFTTFFSSILSLAIYVPCERLSICFTPSEVS